MVFRINVEKVFDVIMSPLRG